MTSSNESHQWPIEMSAADGALGSSTIKDGHRKLGAPRGIEAGKCGRRYTSKNVTARVRDSINYTELQGHNARKYAFGLV